MEAEIPKINFDKRSLDIEVMNFAQLLDKLRLSKDHDPYSVHRIDFFLILIVSQGSYSHLVDFKSYQLTAGSALFIAKNQVHHFTRELQQSEGICIIFNTALLENYYFLSEKLKSSRLFNYHIETPVITQEELSPDSFLGLAKKLNEEYHLPNTFAKSEMLRTLLHVLLLKAERAKQDQAISGAKTQWVATFNAFKNMLEKEYVNTRSSRTYASELFISYKFLNDIVKKLTGKTVKAFIDDYVTIEIKRYLLSTSLSVKEISYKTGFEEPPNMIKFFKKHAHITPFKFRQQS